MSPEINVREKQPTSIGAAENTTTRPMFAPLVDIWESENGLVLMADMPGVETGGLSLDLKDNTLTITGKVEPEDQGRKNLIREFEVGDYYRQFTLAETIDQEGITASLASGVLTLTLPKIAPAQPRRIEVKAE